MTSEGIDWRRAYVKPRMPGGVKGRPAREKIAFDLAFDLGVPVAPVVLIERHDAGLTEERFVDASLVMFPSQQPWWAVRRALNKAGAPSLRDKAWRTLSIDAARALAFDTWVGQTEHQPDHPHNIILGWDQSRSSFVFLDYEYAFGGLDDEWRGERRLECAVAPFPEELPNAVDPAGLEEMTSRIECVPRGTIEAIATRIPPEFLDDGPKGTIIEGLVARQPLVRDALRGKVNR